MDNFDWKLMAALQADGRLTNQEVGGIIGLSASQVSRRRTALEEAGVISGYSARLDSKAIGLDVLAFVHVNLRAHDARSLRAFQRLVASDEAIQEAHAVSGNADYMLKVVASNLEQLADFVTNTLLVSDTISHVQSYVVLKQMKQTSQLPIKR
ncbi:Lrp/AsnC family transcriptional regulator [Burkholderia sp. Bp9031]|uniref:Lrp/AsnC family transcriptional regulator n=1 Tax=Burkholderia sp. Bp9031 TaxID=2184566 RepID=UPI000F5E08FF|nr:Lrp/AsnC family transcriptional regulator [Burkholderia sp. Bp9031]RQZ19714.1 Lrp/AsnC family transcriptional regulator [Burkholderia sp. Bp9031]